MFEKFLKLKRDSGTQGEWTNAHETLPEKDGVYLVICESTSPVLDCQSWAGEGQPELARFHEGWNYPWSSRGTLSIAFWMPLPKFNKRWVKGINERGHWEDKTK